MSNHISQYLDYRGIYGRCPNSCGVAAEFRSIETYIWWYNLLGITNLDTLTKFSINRRNRFPIENCGNRQGNGSLLLSFMTQIKYQNINSCFVFKYLNYDILEVQTFHIFKFKTLNLFMFNYKVPNVNIWKRTSNLISNSGTSNSKNWNFRTHLIKKIKSLKCIIICKKLYIFDYVIQNCWFVTTPQILAIKPNGCCEKQPVVILDGIIWSRWNSDCR